MTGRQGHDAGTRSASRKFAVGTFEVAGAGSRFVCPLSLGYGVDFSRLRNVYLGQSTEHWRIQERHQGNAPTPQRPQFMKVRRFVLALTEN